MYTFNFVSFEKLWAVMPLRFQWLIESVFSFNFLGPGFDSVSPWPSRKQEIYKNANKKICALSK